MPHQWFISWVTLAKSLNLSVFQFLLTQTWSTFPDFHGENQMRRKYGTEGGVHKASLLLSFSPVTLGLRDTRWELSIPQATYRCLARDADFRSVLTSHPIKDAGFGQSVGVTAPSLLFISKPRRKSGPALALGRHC